MHALDFCENPMQLAFVLQFIEFNPGKCDRCGWRVRQRWPCTYEDDFGEEHTIMICWDCDFEVSNGRGTPDDPIEDVLFYREEERRETDPLWYA